MRRLRRRQRIQTRIKHENMQIRQIWTVSTNHTKLQWKKEEDVDFLSSDHICYEYYRNNIWIQLQNVQCHHLSAGYSVDVMSAYLHIWLMHQRKPTTPPRLHPERRQDGPRQHDLVTEREKLRHLGLPEMVPTIQKTSPPSLLPGPALTPPAGGTKLVAHQSLWWQQEPGSPQLSACSPVGPDI